MRSPGSLRVALAGNPNSGKTSLFNALTGASQHVGNYPGVTVEKREGHFTYQGERVEVLDLPGTYSLTSYSPEERVTQDALLEGDLDVVVVVVDSTALKRSLVLLAQLLQLGANPVLCLNMADEAAKAGQKLDLPLLSQLLGFPVVETVGHRGTGVDALKAAMARAARAPLAASRLVLGEQLDQALKALKAALAATPLKPASFPWVATKLLLSDPLFEAKVRETGPAGQRVLEEAARQRQTLEDASGDDISLFITSRYFGFVDGLLREVMLRGPREDARQVSDRIDQVLVNRVLGLPIFLAAMYLVFWLTFTVGEYPMGWIEAGFAWLGDWISSLWAPGVDSPLRSLLVDGIIGGVGGVLVFLPNIILLFLGLIFLEDTGYMARAAFLMDKLMHRFGLHGRSFIPLMSGFGCSIPGIMATRTLENERDRLTTMLVLPLMSCGARLPIWMLLIPAFFPASLRATMLWLIYVIGIVLALVLALVLRRTLLKGEEAPFVMELPPYRTPTLRSVVGRVVERSYLYVRKAGTIILGISILMWVLTSYPKKESFQIEADIAAGKVKVVSLALSPDLEASPQAAQTQEAQTQAALEALQRTLPASVKAMTQDQVDHRREAENMEASVAGRVGKLMEPLIRPLGFDWKLGTAMIGAFAAKEVFVAQIGVIYSLGEADSSSTTLQGALRRDFSPLAGFSLMLFLLIATPCMATVAVTRRESGSWKWALLQFGGLTSLAYILSLLVYQVGSLVS